ncbi:RNA-binding KH domain-containing protein RCF3 [Populus alba x Populus x berolinensis]|nr:RNA-binding KH domain-containing protein RCF3 [Populus alba x Populus x berolinensis]
MERSRSKRNYYYDHQDYDNDNLNNNNNNNMVRTKPRYNNNNYYRQRGQGGNNMFNNNNRFSRTQQQQQPQQQQQDPSSTLMVTTSYRILCHDMKAGGVIGKSGSIIKSIRQHTGAWINVHELIPGDEERIIEISDTRRRDPEGRMPSFSPAQEALFLIHDRILENDLQYGVVSSGAGGFDEDEYVGRGGNRVATRLVVSRMHVGCLLGKGGKIIEQMRMETKTQIRILPRDHTLPRCVSVSEEIVQVIGDVNAVKNAVAIISSRLRESQHRDRSHFHGRVQSPERFLDDDYVPHMNTRRSSMDGPPSFGSRLSGPNYRNNNYSSRAPGFPVDAGADPIADSAQPFYVEDLVFRILCPIDKVNRVVGESDGLADLLQNEIGVDVKVADPVSGSDEQIITICSEEGPDDELFPAQEALLHIQTRIVDLVADKDNIITTRLLVPSSEIGCLEGRDGSLSEMESLTGATIEILPKEMLPTYLSATDELVQIQGEVKAARDALVEVTSRLRSYLYKDVFQKDLPPTASAPGPAGTAGGLQAASSNNPTPAREGHCGGDPPATYQNVQSASTPQLSKDARGSSAETVKQNESEHREDLPPPTMNRIPVTLVTRSILEVVIPEPAVPKLITKSKNKLAQISELSGANVTLVEDRPDETEKIIQISGTPEQAERAQSLLQGFILSISLLLFCILMYFLSIDCHQLDLNFRICPIASYSIDGGWEFFHYQHPSKPKLFVMLTQRRELYSISVLPINRVDDRSMPFALEAGKYAAEIVGSSNERNGQQEAMVLALSTGSWRKVEDTLPSYDYAIAKPVVVKGVWYHMATAARETPFIIRFDMGDDTFSKVKTAPIPYHSSPEYLVKKVN